MTERLTKEQIKEIKKLDILSYFKNYQPDELIRMGRNDSYCLKSHRSLKLSNGMWCWWANGKVGGRSALDYLIKVEGYDFKDACFYLRDLMNDLPPVMEIPRQKRNNGLENLLDMVHQSLFRKTIAGQKLNVMERSLQKSLLDLPGLGDGADAVGDGILDAAFGFAGLPIGGQLNLAATKDIDVLDITDEELDKILANNAAYIKTKIPAGTYTGVDYETQTFGVKCLIIVQKDADEDLIYDLCKAMNEGAADMAAGNALLKDMTDPAFLCTQMPIPLHPGAEKYFKEIGAL